MNRNEIIEKFYHSKSLLMKMEMILVRCGVKHLNLLDDCHHQTFMELCRKPDEFIEEMYNGRMNKTFEGYILNTFKNVCIKLSTDNPKGALIPSMLHMSNINSNGYICPTESGDAVEQDSYTHIPEDKTPDASINDFFTDVSENLKPEQRETLELLIYKKNKPGRYKKEIKDKLEQLTREIKEYADKNDNSYCYVRKNKDVFKSEDEIYTSKKNIYKNTMNDKEFVELVESIKEETYSIINKKQSKITSIYKTRLKMIVDERNAKGETSLPTINWGCSDCVVEVINMMLIPYLESESYRNLKDSVTPKKSKKK